MTIPKLILDPANDQDMLDQSYLRIQESSGGQLTDFSPGSPLAALIEGQVFSIQELLFYLNQLPEAIALEVFRIAGVTRNLGTHATGGLTFLLRSPISSNFNLPIGYELADRDNQTWILTEPLFIPAGSLEATVPVRSKVIGSQGNRPAFGVTINPGLNYVQSVYNLLPMTGGTDLEPLDSLIKRAKATLRDRSVLVSKTDYEEAAKVFLGSGSSCTAIPELGSDRTTTGKIGQVHLFVLDAAGSPPSPQTCSALRAELLPRIFVASSVWVSPATLVETDFDVVVKVDQISEVTAKAVRQSIRDFLDARVYPLGATLEVRELSFKIRQVTGVNRVTQVLIDQISQNKPMGLPYAKPTPRRVTVTLNDPDGRSQTWELGTDVGDPD